MIAYDFVKSHPEIKAAVLEYRWSERSVYEEDRFKFEVYGEDFDQEYSYVGYRTRLLQHLESYTVWDEKFDEDMIDEFGVLRCKYVETGMSLLQRDYSCTHRLGPVGDLVDNDDGDIERLIWHVLLVRESRGECVDVHHKLYMAGIE